VVAHNNISSSGQNSDAEWERKVKITLVESQTPALAPWLIGYIGAEIDVGTENVRRVLPARPNCFIQIILEGGHAMIDVLSGARIEVPVASLFGPLTHYRFDMEISGALRTFSARMQPAAAVQLLGLKPSALVDGFVPIDLAPGMIEALRAASSWHAMAAEMDGWLSQFAKGAKDDDRVAQVARRMRESRGQVSISELAESAELSIHQFQRRFLRLTGLNPKHYARVCRVSHAVHLKEIKPESSWTTVALDSGYTDQSHFIRDFKALTGVRPKDFLRDQAPILRHPKWEG